MGPKLATVVVESRLLVREALKSLMTKNSYRVVCDIGSAAEISSAATSSDEPTLVILGAQSADNALADPRWPREGVFQQGDCAYVRHQRGDRQVTH